jgi:dipeptidyl aminopeptidase/acylaminoacyl peptidase
VNALAANSRINSVIYSMRPTLYFLIALILSSCAPPVDTELPAAQISITFATAIPIPSPEEPTVAPSPFPYQQYSIEALAEREYGGGDIKIITLISANDEFNRFLISYPSDGLTINGFMDVPVGQGPFPVVLVLHGYVDPDFYLVETYTARYAASFAEEGFVAIHPNYRNYSPSDIGPNLFRTGYAIDILNLAAIIQETSGMSGALQKADAENVFLWGHSMGGGIAQRVITVGAEVNGAVLYGSMSGDELQNFERILNVLSDDDRGFLELEVPEASVEKISPINFYERIEVPVSIHHGNIDDVVPLAWSEDLCVRLEQLGKVVECFTYRNMPHIFYGLNDDEFMRRAVDFYQRNMR